MEVTPIKYLGWPRGVNNIASDADMPTNDRGVVNALRDAVNVDILNTGIARRRAGINQKIAESSTHSVYSNDALFVWATTNTLRVTSDMLVLNTILTDVKLAKPISYTDVNGDIYFSNEDINGIIRADGSYEKWGIEPPAVAPTAACAAGPNQYQVTCTFVTKSGEESGAPTGFNFQCADRPTIRINNVPQSSDSRVVATRIYMTNIDGVEMQQVIDLPVGILTWVLNGFFSHGDALKTQFMKPPPPGQLLEFHNGVIYIASGKNVYHTEPLRFGVHDPQANFFMYPSRVTLIKKVVDGIYTSADQLYFMPNIGTTDVTQMAKMPYKAIEGAVCEVPDSEDFFFISDRGFVRATIGGEIVNLTEQNIVIDGYTRGAMCYSSFDGHKAIVALFKNGVQNPAVSGDYLASLNEWNTEKLLY